MLQVAVSILMCFSFAYFSHLLAKFRHWKLESGMDHLHAHARALSRKKCETALVSATSAFYSAILVLALISVFGACACHARDRYS